MQKYAHIHLLLNYSTCFERQSRPSSGVHKTVVAASGADHTTWGASLACCQGTAVAKWLRCCATNRKVAGSIPAGVSGFLIDIKSFRPHYGPGVDSASNRNEYQEYFLGVKFSGV